MDIAEQLNAIILEPGEYALIELPGLTAEQIDHLIESVPDDLRGRLLFVEGKVHTLKPGIPS